MSEEFVRTELLLGREAVEKLSSARVAIFGVGGVGGYVCEALVRSGVGIFDIVDDDVVAVSNLNRQIIALHSTVGRSKVEVMKERMLDINPDATVNARKCFFLPENADEFPFGEYDYVIDAVDTVTAKLEIIMRAKEYGVPVISAMGAGNKLDPGRFKISDIYDTEICPLARVMRKELKKRGIDSLKVVYSDEMPIKPIAAESAECACGTAKEAEADIPSVNDTAGHKKRSTPGSTAFVPAVAGLMIAGEVVKDLCRKEIK